MGTNSQHRVTQLSTALCARGALFCHEPFIDGCRGVEEEEEGERLFTSLQSSVVLCLYMCFVCVYVYDGGGRVEVRTRASITLSARLYDCGRRSDTRATGKSVR